tara:strand:+ start:5231 stop:6325 length:1095 start_codon:yes stop_codon:yes gene_type:complete
MKESFYILIIIVLIIVNLYVYKCQKENFDGVTPLEGIEKNPIFVDLYDDKGNKLNVTLISKPLFSDSDFKQFLVNKPNKIYLGITSYLEFPFTSSNPKDKYIDIEDKYNNPKKYSKHTPNYHDMYNDICEGWLHCFREPEKFININKPHALISESDFVNYKQIKPDKSIKKEYDYIYSCPKVNSDSGCDDWVSYNKNWELGKKCVKVMSDKGLKGLLIGRKGCKVPDNCETTGWVEYDEMLKLYQKAKFVFLPNKADASPRVLTECLSLDVPCLINKNILGGWKYVNDKTGKFFTDENDIEKTAELLLSNLDKYSPRQFIIDNYGPKNSGIKLKNFLFDNFKDRLNVNENEVNYVTIRSKVIDF